MARTQNNRGGNRNSRSNNNNPEGRNQYSSGLMGMARERPATAAAVAAGTVAAGVFLWSKRAQLTEQFNQLSDQIGEWAENMNSGSDRELQTVGDASSFTGAARTGTPSEIGETKTGRRTGSAAAGSPRRSASSSTTSSSSTPASSGNSGQTLA